MPSRAQETNYSWRRALGQEPSGQAVLTTTVFLLIASVAFLLSFSTLALRQARSVRLDLASRQAHVLAEAGVEDVAWRIRNGKPYDTAETVALDGSSASVSVTPGAHQKTVSSSGDVASAVRRAEVILKAGAGVSFAYGVQVGDGGLAMGNNARINGNVFSNGSVIGGNGSAITGSAIASGASHRIDGLTIGDATAGEGRASEFVSTTIRGSSCPNPYCLVENPPRQELPISAEMIQGWKDDAAAGGTCVPPQCDASGDFILTNNASAILGPTKITGRLKLDNGATLTMTGTIWVAGEIDLSNNCNIRLNSSYGSFSGVIITDGKLTISNKCAFQGSGVAGSYIMVVSTRNSPSEEVMTVDNNSVGVIYYAASGRIKFSNNAQAREATAYGMTLDNGATITYESGLADLAFSSGPTGGWNIQSWREVR